MGRTWVTLAIVAFAAGPALADDTSGGTAYEQAQSALVVGDYDQALALAARAVLQRDADATAARMLYADVLARSGQLKRALEFYAGLQRTAATDPARAEIEKRLAALNAVLRLAADHGLHAPAPTKLDGTALYEQAKHALDGHDHKRALALAQKSATSGGPQEAKLVYADALFKAGEYARAKAFYVALHKRWTGPLKATVEKRVVAANGKLALDARDGL